VRDGWGLEEIRAQLEMAEPVSTPKPATGRFRLKTYDELSRQSDRPDLIKNTFPAGGFIVVASAPGAGKTTFAIEIGTDVGSDLLFHGRAVTPGPVVLVAAEGAAKLAHRVQACAAWHKIEGPANLYFVTEAVCFGEEEEVDAFLAALGTLPAPPVLLVIDTLARCMIGADENSARDVGEFIHGCDRVREKTGASVLVLHHVTKNGGTERGSGALRGAADTLVIMTREDDLVTITCDKQKDGPPFEPLHFRLKVVELDPEHSACVLDPIHRPEQRTDRTPPSKLSESRRKVLDSLGDAANGATFSQWLRLAQETHRVSESTFQRAAKALLTWELVAKRGARYFVKGQQS